MAVLAAQETVAGLVCFLATLLLALAVDVVGAAVGGPFVENQAYFGRADAIGDGGPRKRLPEPVRVSSLLRLVGFTISIRLFR